MFLHYLSMYLLSSGEKQKSPWHMSVVKKSEPKIRGGGAGKIFSVKQGP